MKRTWFCDFAAKYIWLLCSRTNTFLLNLPIFWTGLSLTTTLGDNVECSPHTNQCGHYHILSRGYCPTWYAIETYLNSSHFNGTLYGTYIIIKEDSVIVLQEKFLFHGDVSGLTAAIIEYKGIRYRFYVEPGDIHLLSRGAMSSMAWWWGQFCSVIV